MLPKIFVSGAEERAEVIQSIDLLGAKIMSYEGSEAKVDDLRHWINFGVNVVTSSPDISLVIWEADSMSAECQAVLLKPLEETRDETNLILVVKNENGLLPTILSRCVVLGLGKLEKMEPMFWSDMRKCFSEGPSACLDLAENLEKEQMELALEEVMVKLKNGLVEGVSKNRLSVLKLAIDCLAKLRKTNVNPKLAFGNFLISSWKLVKA